MTWTSPTFFSVFDVLTAAQMNAIGDNLNFLHNGVISYDRVAANVGPTSGSTELTLATVTQTFDGDTRIEVGFDFFGIDLSNPGDEFRVRLYDGATQVGGTRVLGESGSYVRAVLFSPSGSHTLTARLVRTAGSGDGTLFANATNPAWLTVSQIN